MNEIIVFTLNGCSHCVILKDSLTEKKIPFAEIEITSNKKIWDQVVEQTGHNVLPTVFIKKENSEVGPVYVPGRDFNSPDEIIPILEKFL